MLFLNKDDYFELYLSSMLSNYDKDTIANLYQPIIGFKAADLYFSFWSMVKLQNVFDMFTMEDLIEMTSMSINEIQEAKSKLEGIGLIQTFYKTENHKNYYLFQIFAPKTPHDFFEDVLFKGLLVDKLGPKKANRIAFLYKEKPLSIEGYQDVSNDFKHVFSPNLEDTNCFLTKEVQGDKTFKRKTKDISKGFNFGDFLKTMEETYCILKNKFSSENLKDIADISLLYGIDELSMADYVSQSYRPNQEPIIDLEYLRGLCIKDKNLIWLRKENNGDSTFDFNSKLGKKVELMSSTSSLDYLKIKQHYTNPAPSDIAILNALSNMGINPQVINAIIDYSLEECDNALISNYCTKLGAQVQRAGITNALDDMNSFYQKKNRKKKTETTTVDMEKVAENESKEKVSEDEAKDFFTNIKL